MSLAILISIYNEPESILRQAYKVFKELGHRVYIAVNEYDFKTVELALEIFEGFEVLVSPSKSHLKSSNINYALDFINEDIIAVFDVDNIPTTEYIDACMRTLEDESIGMVSGRETGYNDDNLLTEIEDFQQLDYFRIVKNLYKIFTTEENRHIALLGAGYFVRSKYLKKIKLSENTMTEDDDLAVRLVQHGVRSVLIDEVFTILNPIRLRDSINQRIRWITGRFQLHKTFPTLKDISLGLYTAYSHDIGLCIGVYIKVLFGVLLMLAGVWWMIPLLFLFDLENEYWSYVKTHGILERKLSYTVTIYEYLYLWIFLKAYINFKVRPLHWNLTNKG